MKSFKIIDLVVQTILIIGGPLYSIISISKSGINPFGPYVVVGSWQFISYSIHYFFFTPTIFQHDRINYGKIVLGILSIGFMLLIALLLEVSVAVPFSLIYLIALMVSFPLLAVYYVVICWKEYRIMIKRELIHLK